MELRIKIAIALILAVLLFVGFLVTPIKVRIGRVAPTTTPISDVIHTCPGPYKQGYRVIFKSGRVVNFCPDGRYTDAELESGRLFDYVPLESPTDERIP